jgi:hypothetical protein
MPIELNEEQNIDDVNSVILSKSPRISADSATFFL